MKNISIISISLFHFLLLIPLVSRIIALLKNVQKSNLSQNTLNIYTIHFFSHLRPNMFYIY